MRVPALGQALSKTYIGGECEIFPSSGPALANLVLRTFLLAVRFLSVSMIKRQYVCS